MHAQLEKYFQLKSILIVKASMALSFTTSYIQFKENILLQETKFFEKSRKEQRNKGEILNGLICEAHTVLLWEGALTNGSNK